MPAITRNRRGWREPPAGRSVEPGLAAQFSPGSYRTTGILSTRPALATGAALATNERKAICQSLPILVFRGSPVGGHTRGHGAMATQSR
jgi:hypothetical protein